jgi:uncharacterized phage protein (TIGR02218 family)
MARIFFDRVLDTVASFWRIHRRDGVTLGFTTHDCDLWFDGVLHRAAPGMVPSSIRRTSGFADDGVEVEGALSHKAITAADMQSGRYEGARIAIGAVDWEGDDAAVLYRGRIAGLVEDDGGFTAQLQSAKADLARDPIPRTSPGCRARFCDVGCTLSAPRFTRRAVVSAMDRAANRVGFAGIDPALFAQGELRWLDGPLTGLSATILSADASGLLLDRPLDEASAIGDRASLREGCDHTIATCSTRFANAANFQGEPFLPGNDLLAQYPMPR